MIVKDIEIFHLNGFRNVPKLGVWFKNKPSGNPAFKLTVGRQTQKALRREPRLVVDSYVNYQRCCCR
jgi:hypothetical protein